jgi:hypothetical protein
VSGLAVEWSCVRSRKKFSRVRVPVAGTEKYSRTAVATNTAGSAVADTRRHRRRLRNSSVRKTFCEDTILGRPTDRPLGGGRPRGPVTRHEREHRGADACACVAGIRDRRRAARAATRYDSGFPRRASRRAASPVGLLRSLSGTNDGQPAGCDSGGASWRSRHRGEGFGQLAKQPYREKQPYGPRLAGATPRRRVRPQLAIAAPRRRVSVAAGDRDTEAKSSAAAGDRDTEAHGSATAGDRDIEAQGSATAGGRDTEAAGSATAGDRDSREGFRHGCQSRHRGEGFGRPRLAIATPRRRVRPRLAIATTRRRVPSRPSVATPRRMVRSRMTIATPRRRVPSQPAAATRSVECRMCRRKFSRAVRVSDGGRGRGRSVCVCVCVCVDRPKIFSQPPATSPSPSQSA